MTLLQGCTAPGVYALVHGLVLMMIQHLLMRLEFQSFEGMLFSLLIIDAAAYTALCTVLAQ